MVLAKSKNTVGLGNSLMHDRFGHGKGADRRKVPSGIRRTGPNGETYVTNAPTEASWVKMRSITEQAPLDEFLTTAELAGTDFTAEKMNNVKIIHPDQKNPYVLSADEERMTISKHDANKKRLAIPRRPPWHERMRKEDLDSSERAAFLEWRRGLAELQESNDLLMTPFERNIEVWRQLWRVVERSDVVVQIVDARNPLLFRSEDLESYVKEVDSRKENMLLVNKADMMTLRQRQAWADYFASRGISYRFFSASQAAAEKDVTDDESEGDSDEDAITENGGGATDESRGAVATPSVPQEEEPQVQGKSDDGDDREDDRTRILSPAELEEVFLGYLPEFKDGEERPNQVTVGLVGYPNVGKSSTINTLVGMKKVSVSSTPGKTKHFQTIHLSPDIILCDCPGLVFPNFATTRAELVCNGILPIDQLREFTGPAGVVCQRIPREFLEATYGITIPIRPLEEGGTGVPTAEELLVAYAIARGFTKTGQGQPDESRAARYILKDYVNGRLLFCHPPPMDPPIDIHDFNRELYGGETTSVVHTEADDEPFERTTERSDAGGHSKPPVQGAKSAKLDKNFFAANRGNAGHLTMPFNHKYSEQGTTSGKHLSGRKQREMIALESGTDPSEISNLSQKKHFKGKKGKSTAKADD
ncbi:MAG: hypothetical protein M1823_000327 [Watsoniomyces obsoletus]|nr:MAG: hypothetical protein M1823_000327 [Watsoniomyces obsoletus]